MKRDFQEEYQNYIESDMPDLWSRIEPNLKEKNGKREEEGKREEKEKKAKEFSEKSNSSGSMSVRIDNRNRSHGSQKKF